MAVQGVNFGNEQQKQSSGVVFPVLGAAAGAGVTAFTKFGKKPVALEGLTKDQFEKSTKDVTLEGDDKTAFEKVKSYLTEQEAKPATEAKPAEPEKTAATPAPAATAAPTAEAPKTKEAQELEAETKHFFGEKGTEVPARQLLGGTTIENYKKGIENDQKTVDAQTKTVQNIREQIQDSQDEIKRLRANLKEEINVAESTETPAAAESRAKLKKDLIKAEAELNTAKEKVAYNEKYLPDDVASAQAEVDAKQATVDGIKNSVSTPQEKAKDKAAKESEKLSKESAEADKAAKAAEEEAKTAKANKTPDAVVKEENAANLRKIANKKKALADEAAGIAKDKEIVDSGIRKQRAQNQVSDAVQKGEKLQATLKTAETDLAKITSALNNKNIKLGLAAEVGDNGNVQLTRFQEKVGGGIKAEIQAAAEKEGKVASTIPESITKAFESIKSKLKPGMNGKNILIGSGIGLAAGILVKLMADGSSKSEA